MCYGLMIVVLEISEIGDLDVKLNDCMWLEVLESA